MTNCWAPNTTDRPTMSAAIMSLQVLLDTCSQIKRQIPILKPHGKKAKNTEMHASPGQPELRFTPNPLQDASFAARQEFWSRPQQPSSTAAPNQPALSVQQPPHII